VSHRVFVPRHAASAVAEALADTRVVLINGARQVGFVNFGWAGDA
jgi:hypothetical protein